MQLVIYVMNKTEMLKKFLKEVSDCGIKGGTILESRGMARELVNEYNEFNIFGSLRNLVNDSFKTTKTILFVVEEHQVNILFEVINRVVGGLDKPDSGIAFSVDISKSMGLKKYIGDENDSSR